MARRSSGTRLLLLSVQLLGVLGSLAARPATVDAQRRGVHLDYGAVLARPYLDENSREMFRQVGQFRPGLGARAGVGYDVHRFGATVFAEFAGVEIGPERERERDGIEMGRESGILGSYGLTFEWRPARELGAWQPALWAGYLRQGVNNVLLTRDQLPAFVQDSTSAPDGAAGARTGGVAGSGIRLGSSLERVLPGSGLPGRLSARVSVGADLVRFTRASYDLGEWTLPAPGRGITPHLGLMLRWSPGAPSDGSRVPR